jgi:N-acetylmuramoyl-L-alanine amidase
MPIRTSNLPSLRRVAAVIRTTIPLVSCLVVVSCGARDGAQRTAPDAGRAAAEGPLPARAEVVARADALAVDGAKKGGPDGAGLTLEAARLRARTFRVEGTLADALEATELLKSAAAVDSPLTCDAALELALLEGEIKSDPASEYRALYALRAKQRGKPCARRIEPILATLAAFAPPTTELAALDTAAGTPVPGGNASGQVVLPEVVPSLSREPANITGVERYGGKDASRVVVLVTRPTLFEVGSLPEEGPHGPRLFIDIKNARFQGARNYAGEGLVDRVRVGEQGSATRVVLDLRANVSHRVFYLPEPFRLVIDVSKDLAAPIAGGPRHVRRVVLDPGHGGYDPGAVGPGGLREKDVVLDIAHRAAPLIARELGVSTLLTRDGDTFVPLDERVARANAFSSDLFVSIHCNASESSASRGTMTFVLDASRDDLAARVAARENAASEAAAAELANAMSRVLDPTTLSRSNHLAELLQRASMASLSPHYPEVLDQGVKSAGFYVLAGARMPAVLFETSFISNPVEERQLDSGDYRQKMADAIVNAVRAFRDGM